MGQTYLVAGITRALSSSFVPNADKSRYTTFILHNFCRKKVSFECTDGRIPNGDLIIDVDGNLYGTTEFGAVSAKALSSY